MFYVYVLELINGSFYKGQTQNLGKRLKEHLYKNVVSTKNKLPFRLRYVQVCRSRQEARDLEKFIKSGFGRETIREIIGLI